MPGRTVAGEAGVFPKGFGGSKVGLESRKPARRYCAGCCPSGESACASRGHRPELPGNTAEQLWAVNRNPRRPAVAGGLPLAPCSPGGRGLPAPGVEGEAEGSGVWQEVTGQEVCRPGSESQGLAAAAGLRFLLRRGRGCRGTCSGVQGPRSDLCFCEGGRQRSPAPNGL